MVEILLKSRRRLLESTSQYGRNPKTSRRRPFWLTTASGWIVPVPVVPVEAASPAVFRNEAAMAAGPGTPLGLSIAASAPPARAAPVTPLAWGWFGAPWERIA